MDANLPAGRLQFLQSHALFGGLTEEQLAPVVALLKEEHFEPGAIIVREGDAGDRMHFILSGSAKVMKDATPDIPDDNEFAQLSLMKPGDAFGEMGLIDVQSRSASVIAREAVTTLSLSNKALHSLFKTQPTIFTLILLNLARELSRRLRKMNDKAAHEK